MLFGGVSSYCIGISANMSMLIMVLICHNIFHILLIVAATVTIVMISHACCCMILFICVQSYAHIHESANMCIVYLGIHT